MSYHVTIPGWESLYILSNRTSTKYWLWQDREKLPIKHKEKLANSPIVIGKKVYCCDNDKNRFVKNSKKAGTPNTWTVNGQDLYSAVLNWRMRKTITTYYHNYFSFFINEQLSPIEIPEGRYLSISCDIYEIERGNMPDVSNMWLLEKWFEDSLTMCNIIPDDGPKYVRESGRKRYHFVNTEEERKLVFNIELI